MLASTAAQALVIVPGSLTVSRSIDSGVTWLPVTPSGTTTVFVGDWVSVTVTLVNDTGRLGNLLTDPLPGAPPAGDTTDLNLIINGDGFGTNNSLDNGSPPELNAWRLSNNWFGYTTDAFWPGQYWIWPLQGICAFSPPSPGCPNDVYPTRSLSPVSLVDADPVLNFNYNQQWLNRTDMFDGSGWTALPPMPRLRGWHAVATNGGLLYVIGGCNASGTVAAFDVFDMGAKAWLPPLADLPTPRIRLAAAAVPTAGVAGQIFVFGGQDPGTGAAMPNVDIYDIAKNTWSSGGPLTFARFGLTATYDPIDGLIYVIGGDDGTGQQGYIESYDPAGPGPGLDTGQRLVYPRSGHGAAFSTVDNQIYIIGGYGFGLGYGPPTNMAFVEQYDPSSFGPPVYPGAFDLPSGTGDAAVAAVGPLIYAAFGREEGFNSGGSGNPTPSYHDLFYNQVVDPSSGSSGVLGMNPPRSRAAAGSDGATLFVTGGFGLGYLDAEAPGNGGTNETQRVTWIYQMRTAWPLPGDPPGTSLDFKILAVDADDGDGSSGFEWEGSGLDCTTCGDLNLTTPVTLTHILQDEFGGKIVIVSPLQVVTATATVLDPGGRPPQTAWVGDTIQASIDVINQGLTVTVSGGEACATTRNSGTFCVAPLGSIGACGGSPQPYAPVSPALPFTLTPGGSKTVVWSYSALGAGCTLDSCGGNGAVYWDGALLGALFTTGTLFVTPAPLSITSTIWVDPDGAGAGFSPIPLGVSPTVPGAAGPFYYMGRETLQAAFTFTNTSGLYAMTFSPTLTKSNSFKPDTENDIVQLSGPVPPGPYTLPPGGSVTVNYSFAKSYSSTAYLEQCNPVPQLLSLVATARGVCSAIDIDMQPTPFEPFDVCVACPVGSHAISFNAPGSASVGAPYTVDLHVHNFDTRPFVLEMPSTSLFLNLVPSSGATFTLGPPPLATTVWLGSQIRTFSWQVTPTSTGKVDTTAGLDIAASGLPCLRGCSESLPYCELIDQQTAYIVPGRVSIAGVRWGPMPPAKTCESAGDFIWVAYDITNTSYTDTFTATNYDSAGFPSSQPAGYAPPSTTIVPNVVPSPLVILPGRTMTVTFYIDPLCGSADIGTFSSPLPLGPGHHWVEGYFNDALGNLTNCCDSADWGGPPITIPHVDVTQPANLSAESASLWTDQPEYSVGQKIRVFFSVTNIGGDDLTNFTAAIATTIGIGGLYTGNPQLQPSPGTWPTPAVPWTYTGMGSCAKPPPPPYKANLTFEWDFDVVQSPGSTATGTFHFTATAGGYDAGCGSYKTTDTPPMGVESALVRIASSSILACTVWADTSLVTMSLTCVGCPAFSTCDKQSGVGCIDITMVAKNSGQVPIIHAMPSHGSPIYIAPCPGGLCTTASAFAVSEPPEATAPGGTIPANTSVTYAWTYSPTGLGCMRIMAEFTGQDGATGATRYCDDWTTGCISILPRYPLELTLISVPSQVAPGQTFTVKVRVYNPGGTPAGLQGGEPAIQFYQLSTGGKVTEQYDVTPPPPVVIPPGQSITIAVTVTAHKNADPGAIEIRVPQGDRFIARDAATGQSFPAVDHGGPLGIQVMDLKNLLQVSGPNPTRLSAAGGRAVVTYQIADAGTGHGRTTLKVYSLTGELVRILVDKPATVERADVPWDGRNESGQVVASGVYIIRLEGPAYSSVKKLAIVK